MEEEACVFLTHSLLAGGKPHFQNANILTVNRKYVIPNYQANGKYFSGWFYSGGFFSFKNTMN